jgi:hypothetical protein
MILVLAVVGCPNLVWIAGVHVKDTPLIVTAQGNLTPTVDDNFRSGVVENLRSFLQYDSNRVGTTVKGNNAALGDGIYHGLAGAAHCGAISDFSPTRLKARIIILGTPESPVKRQ